MDNINTQVLLTDLLGNLIVVPMESKEKISFKHVFTGGVWAEPLPFEAVVCLDNNKLNGLLHGRLLSISGESRRDCSKSFLLKTLEHFNSKVYAAGTIELYMIEQQNEFYTARDISINTPSDRLLQKIAQSLQAYINSVSVEATEDGKVLITYGETSIIDFCENILLTRFLLSKAAFNDNGKKLKACFAPRISEKLKSSNCSFIIKIQNSCKKKYRDRILALSDDIRALTLILNPHVNSYKKITPRNESLKAEATWRSIVSCDQNNNAFAWFSEDEEYLYLTIRSLDSTANLFLASTVILELINTPRPLRKGWSGSLPSNLGEAVEAFEKNTRIKGILGESVWQTILNSKRNEWYAYCDVVHPFEIKQFIS